MNHIKLAITRARNYVKRNPKSLIAFSFAGLLLFAFSVEAIRALYFQNKADAFAQSGVIQELQSQAEQLYRQTNKEQSSYFCSIGSTELLARFNQAYDTSSTSSLETITQLRATVKRIGSVPAYSSLLDSFFIMERARKRSELFTDTFNKITSYVTEDLRSAYCTEVASILGNVFFIEQLSTPEGVAALISGQKEDYQTRALKARDRLVSMAYPEVFGSVHFELSKHLNQLIIDLQADSNNYQAFSNQIARTQEAFEADLLTIKSLANDLQKIPEQLLLTTHQFSE